MDFCVTNLYKCLGFPFNCPLSKVKEFVNVT